MTRIEKILLAVGLNDYTFEMTVDLEKAKITQLVALEDINEEEITVKTGTVLKNGRKLEVSFKDIFENFFVEYDENDNKIIDMTVELYNY